MELAAASPRERAAFDDHLAACGNCRQLIADAMRRFDIDDTLEQTAKATPRRSKRISSDDPIGLGVIHQYEIIRELGRGGMGRVFLARDTKLGRRVAIKFLASRSQSLTRRFLVEARTTAQLNHENIVVIHEVNEFDELPLMVLEYLEGRPLTALIREGPVAWAAAVELTLPVVRALIHAHENGVIHRDLKPDNVFLTTNGVVKVLDFGIAKAFTGPEAASGPPAAVDLGKHDLRLTHDGAMLGTLPYMSPEQFGMDDVDARTDVWAVGLILFELIVGRHPLAPVSPERLMYSAVRLELPMPLAGEAMPDIPEGLARVIDGCLRKRKEERTPTARDLADLLKPFLPGHSAPALNSGEDPYPGLTAFQESDAGRFFGREHDVARLLARLHEQPLVCVTGLSGVGKSSFVRAGVIPALKGSARWEMLTFRPGRDPIGALATSLEPLVSDSQVDPSGLSVKHDRLIERMKAEPGYVGAVLRRRARERGAQILVFVDQFEELYTVAEEDAGRNAFAACLAGIADDSATPLRVVLSMRSDFLDRLSSTPRLLDEVSRGLLFLAPPDREGLRQALVRPLEIAGYRFEDPAIIDDVVTSLQAVPGALPLLQFAASRLWEARDRGRRLVTTAAYAAMGGISGALAAHADDTLAHMPLDARRLARPIFQRLVTPERTRAQVEVADLLALGPDPNHVERAIEHLVRSRLLIAQTRGGGEGTVVEMVHESLIATWPRLRRWLDESEEDAAFLDQLQVAAKQWDARGRPAGLLWRGEAASEARRWTERDRQGLVPRERDFLNAVARLATRASRIARAAIIGTIVFLSLLVAAGAAGILVLRQAKQDAVGEAKRASAEATRARKEEVRARVAAERAQRAEGELGERLREIQEKDQLVAKGKEERARAESERAKAESANTKLRQSLRDKQAEIDELNRLNRHF